MEKLSTITEMQNVLNRAYKLGLYEILKISDTLFDDIEELRCLVDKSIAKKVDHNEIYIDDILFHIYKCSMCGRHFDANRAYSYCPNCGQRIGWSDDEWDL